MSDPDGTVQQRLAEAYQGSGVGSWRFLLAGLGVAVVWWQVFDPIGAFVLGLGLVVFSFGIGGARTALAMRSWPTAEATVLESTVFTQHELRERFPGLEKQSGSTSGGYVPFVRYRYTADGEDRIGVRVSPFDDSVPRRRWAEAIVDDYGKNAAATVRYDPQAPDRSYLRTWVRSRLLVLWVGLSGVCVGFAVWSAAGYPYPLAFWWLGAALLVLLGLRQFLLGLRTRRWPTTGGEILATEVRSSSSDGNTSYSPRVRYEYAVDGTTYVSSAIRVGGGGPSFDSRSAAQSWLDDIEAKEPIAVRYDPKRPDRTVLEPSGLSSGFVLTALGLLGMAVLYNITTGQPLPYQTRVLEAVESVVQDLLDRL